MQEFETEIKTADGVMDVFVCHPDQDGPHPAVILYMDAPGIREELRDMAIRIGTVGYTVLLPNMYYRTGREGHYGFDLARFRDDDDHRARMFEVMSSLTNARVVYGAVAPTPIRAAKTEAALEGLSLNEASIQSVLDVADSEVNPISDVRASDWYRRHLVRVMTQEVLQNVANG